MQSLRNCDRKKLLIWRKYLHIIEYKEKHETNHLTVCTNSVKRSKYSLTQNFASGNLSKKVLRNGCKDSKFIFI